MGDQHLIELDIRGQVCPSTLLVTLREITRHHQELKDGRLELVVLTDNRNAIVTVPQAAQNMGLLTEISRESGYYRIHICAGEENE